MAFQDQKTQHDLWKQGEGYQEYLLRVKARIEGHPGTVLTYSAARGKRVVGTEADGTIIEQTEAYRPPYMRKIRW